MRTGRVRERYDFHAGFIKTRISRERDIDQYDGNAIRPFKAEESASARYTGQLFLETLR